MGDSAWGDVSPDALGGTVLLTDEDGDVTDTYDYDAWGNVVDHTGETEQPYQYVGQLGYYTHWQDSNVADMQNLGVRYYEPEVGRFGQRDMVPKNHPESAYMYSWDSPILLVDPSGRWNPRTPCSGIHPGVGDVPL